MSISESIHKKKARVRKPQVHITYEVDTGTGPRLKELPFVVGVIADLAGQSTAPRPNLKTQERKFVNIDRDNFDDVLKSMQPRLAFRVDNKLTGDDVQLGVELKFQKLSDFDPENVANQVKPLAELIRTRKELADLLGRVEVSDVLEAHLKTILENPEIKAKLKQHLEAEASTAATPPQPEKES